MILGWIVVFAAVIALVLLVMWAGDNRFFVDGDEPYSPVVTRVAR
jgi:hypothetical protein